MKLLVIFATAVQLATTVNGHGMMMEPPSRSSMWRLGYKTPINWDDDGLNCGNVPTEDGHGKCGECGDPYSDPRPRPNEDGGKYGLGIITRNYEQAQEINVTVHLTTNHMGWFEFRMCPNNNVKKPVEQSCLDEHLLELADGSGTRYHLKNKHEENNDWIYLKLKLPEGLVCKQCVMQWHYQCGNTWGICPDGHGAQGCGPQETFRNCADVAIE